MGNIPLKLCINDGFLSDQDRYDFASYLRLEHPSLIVYYNSLDNQYVWPVHVYGGTKEERSAIRRAAIAYIDGYLDDIYRALGSINEEYVRSCFNFYC